MKPYYENVNILKIKGILRRLLNCYDALMEQNSPTIDERCLIDHTSQEIEEYYQMLIKETDKTLRR